MYIFQKKERHPNKSQAKFTFLNLKKLTTIFEFIILAMNLYKLVFAYINIHGF